MGAAVGSRIQRFEIRAHLGSGGMGAVYRAYDPRLDRDVAVKLLSTTVPKLTRSLLANATVDLRSTKPIEDVLLHEARLMARLSHPHVVPVYEVGIADGSLFVVMEYIEGTDLERWLAQPRSIEAILDVFVQAARGLAAAHERGVIHRDFKPGNVLVGRDGRARVADFGVSQLSGGDVAMIRIVDPGGTPHYMAPELWRGAPATTQSDVYSFCTALGDALGGERDVARSMSSRLRTAITNGLSGDPSMRPTLAELIAALDDAIGGAAKGVASSLPTSTSRRIAVLPFAASAELAELAEGLSEEIVDALTMTRSLRVVPLSSVRVASGGGIDANDLGKALHVDVVVEGSLRRRGEHVRIAARATGVGDGFLVWANKLDATDAELLAASDEIARAVARALAIEIDLPPRAAHDAKATALYLEGKAKLRAAWFTTAIEAAIDDLQQALVIEPDDPGILATLGLALARSVFLGQAGDVARGRMLAERAVARAPLSGEAWLALGFACWYSNATADAARAFVRAIARTPGVAIAQAGIGAILLEAGALDEAILHLEAAASLDAIRLPIADLPRAYIYAGRETEAFALLHATTGPVRHFALSQSARFHLWRGEVVALESPASARDVPDDVELFIAMLQRFSKTGVISAEDRANGDRLVRAENARVRASRGQLMVEFLMFVGDHCSALDYVEMCVAAGLQDHIWMQRCPLLDPLRSDAKFRALAATVADRAIAVLEAARIARDEV